MDANGCNVVGGYRFSEWKRLEACHGGVLLTALHVNATFDHVTLNRMFDSTRIQSSAERLRTDVCPMTEDYWLPS